ncbi:MAG: glycoside hydrolase [Actinomycetota bacterium]|nr:glycoside hydrolase [Actinomycetota bacterium]
MTRDDRSPSRAFAAPTKMLVHPKNPRIIVAATANLRTRVCHLVRSEDAGRTWRIVDALPAPNDYPFCTTHEPAVSQSAIAWGRDGVLYYALLGYAEDEGPRGMGVSVRTSVVLARSTDLGDSWSHTLVMDNRRRPEPAPSAGAVTGLAVDTSGANDVVFVGYSLSYGNVPADSPLNDDPVVVSVSTDGGRTFAEGTNLNQFSALSEGIAGNEYPLIMTSTFGRPFLIAHDGVVMAVSGANTPFNRRPPGGNYFAWPYRHPLPYLLARSTDQGRTWTMSKLSPPVFAGVGHQTGMGWTPHGGADGTFVFAYAATPGTADTSGTVDIVVQRSTDRGRTWTEPLAIDDDDPVDRYTGFYPTLSVAPNGRVDVVWQDNRDITDFHFNVRYTYSTDGGRTWAPNIKVNDRPLNFHLGVSFNSDVRQPPGVASANEYAVFGWADTRFGDEVTQTQDNFSTIAQFKPLPADSSVIPVLAAVFGGLVTGGAVLIGMQFLHLRRRRRSAPVA